MSISPQRPTLAAMLWGFTLGMVAFGILGLLMFFTGAAMIAAPSVSWTIAQALFMVLLTGGAALWAIRARRIGLGSGLLIGYALAAVASGGQCTFLTTAQDYGFLSGAVFYIFGLGLALAIAVVVGIISAISRARGGES